MSTGIFIHSHAIVDPAAQIGEGSRVWAFAHVLGGAKIGKDCNIGNYSFVESGAILGDKVTVKNGVQVWEGIHADDGSFLGPNCVFTNDMRPRSFLKLPKESWLLETHIGKGASIGANATILCGTKIGAFAFIAAGSMVTKDVPAFALMAGLPARRKAWVCVCAKTLVFKGALAKCACKRSYKKLAKDKIVATKNEMTQI